MAVIVLKEDFNTCVYQHGLQDLGVKQVWFRGATGKNSDH